MPSFKTGVHRPEEMTIWLLPEPSDTAEEGQSSPLGKGDGETPCYTFTT